MTPLPLHPARDTSTVFVNETFTSFQGEGPLAGQRCVFVRFSHCNLKCTWCDTDESWDFTKHNREQVSSRVPVAELVSWVADQDVDLMVITGGEPMLQQKAMRNVASYFTAIDGRTDTGEPAKSALLREHLTRHGINPAMAVLIGDSTDDAHAACAAGAHSILVATGTTNRARLDTTGAPVVDTIPDAIRLLGLASTIPGINAHRHHTGTR
ncbi:MAG: HAD hydrolase-like protein [Pseudonocardiaceae bacterium]